MFFFFLFEFLNTIWSQNHIPHILNANNRITEVKIPYSSVFQAFHVVYNPQKKLGSSGNTIMTDFKIALCRFIILTLFLLTLAGAQVSLAELPK